MGSQTWHSHIPTHKYTNTQTESICLIFDLDRDVKYEKNGHLRENHRLSSLDFIHLFVNKTKCGSCSFLDINIYIFQFLSPRKVERKVMDFEIIVQKQVI